MNIHDEIFHQINRILKLMQYDVAHPNEPPQVKILVDSNIFIQAQNREYQFKVCPAFWELLKALHERGILFSINKVKNEIINQELKNWINTLPPSFFLDSSVVFNNTYKQLMNWSDQNPKFLQIAKDDFADGNKADAFLVAMAAHLTQTTGEQWVILTHETYDENIKRRIKIPNAALHLGVPCIDLFNHFLPSYAGENFSCKIK